MALNVEAVQPKVTPQSTSIVDVGERKSAEVKSARDPAAAAGVQPSDLTSSGPPAEVETMRQHFVSQASEAAPSARRELAGDGGAIRIGVQARIDAAAQGVSGVGGSKA
jgi:hypothetical protein